MDKEKGLEPIEKKCRPFSTGSQYADWSARNCGTCKKGFKDRPDQNPFQCEWERALCIASICDGQITQEVARAIGYLDNRDCYIWECPGWARR